ncbi:hypothetical protein INT47_000264 [Mucor saturninus]|uniref:Uncharacterized protein n=1 Tax=Mucor saturninus TaxID=64648 RepID=A0A8H7QHE4_9FUNG|nr:hypothetical protein INT47_000264 [Mucor saturninus]
MNNSATTFRISKLEQSISDLNEKLDRQNDMLKDLAQLLAPSFAQSCDSYFSSDILEASQQAKETGIANSLNPNLLGKRDIPKVLDEAAKQHKPTKKNSFPSPRLRLLALINYFQKEKDGTNLQLENRNNLRHYAILKSLARKIHDDMVEHINKDLPISFIDANRARIRAAVHNNSACSNNQRISEQTREESSREEDESNDLYTQYIEDDMSDSGGEPDFSCYDRPYAAFNRPTPATATATASTTVTATLSPPVSLAAPKRMKARRIISKDEYSQDTDPIIKPKHGRKQYKY